MKIDSIQNNIYFRGRKLDVQKNNISKLSDVVADNISIKSELNSSDVTKAIKAMALATMIIGTTGFTPFKLSPQSYNIKTHEDQTEYKVDNFNDEEENQNDKTLVYLLAGLILGFSVVALGKRNDY